MTVVELTGFTKANGRLTKRISLAADGTVKSDGSACIMAQGTAQRVHINDVADLATVIENIHRNRPSPSVPCGLACRTRFESSRNKSSTASPMSSPARAPTSYSANKGPRSR